MEIVTKGGLKAPANAEKETRPIDGGVALKSTWPGLKLNFRFPLVSMYITDADIFLPRTRAEKPYFVPTVRAWRHDEVVLLRVPPQGVGAHFPLKSFLRTGAVGQT